VGEAGLPEAAPNGIEFRLAEPAAVGRVGADEVDGNLLDGHGAE
jgi:hypothetical protein